MSASPTMNEPVRNEPPASILKGIPEQDVLPATVLRVSFKEVEKKEKKEKRKSWLSRTKTKLDLAPVTRSRSYTLSASANNIMPPPEPEERRVQFRRERSNSMPSYPQYVPKNIDEIWDEVNASWDEVYSQKGRWLTNVLYKKGIPNARRELFWTKLSKLIPNTDLIRCSLQESEGDDHKCLYKTLLEIPRTYHEQQIRADITRTFPSEKPMYAPEFQQSLFNVLKAFSLYDQGVGYCQGLSFVAALLLMHLKEEQAFFVLIRLLKGHNLRSFYTEDMKGVRLRMYQVNKITQQLFPRMYSHMEELGVSVAVVTTPWFMTAFGYQLPLDVALRVTDVLLFEGIPALFRIALAILVLCEGEIMDLGLDGVMDYFRSDLREKFQDPQKLMTTAYAVNVSLAQLEKLEVEFLQSEHSADKVESEFSQQTAADILEKENNLRFSKVLIENHELKERLIRKNNEYSSLSKLHEATLKKGEEEKIALIEKLGEILDRLNDAESENSDLKEQLANLEECYAQTKKKCAQMTECSETLAEELSKMRKKVGAVDIVNVKVK